MVKKIIITKDLEKAIEEAKEIDKEDYTAESIELLNTTLTKAEEVLANKIQLDKK
ncbi:hypothetical protein ACQKM9_10570 [Viridibacillus sp. NPDC093762]|uniref:hypothetical protein n=1 Tax=Viridibacillus sp. NPDC093762 TaxID=3390720 RepID=UPI003D025824